MNLVTKAKTISASATVLLARIVGADGAPIVQADISSILMKVFDTSTSPPTLVNTGGTSLVVADVISNTLQTDPTGLLWTDATGYNFSHELNGHTYTPGDSITYRVELKFTPTTGEPFYVLFELTTIPVYSE